MTTAQIKNSFKSIGEIEATVAPSSLVLKLSFTNASLRYFVLSQTSHQIIFWGDYTLHNISSDIELANRVEKIFEKDEILQINYSKILVGLDDTYSVMPTEFSFLINQEEQQSQNLGDTELVYQTSEKILQTIKRLFPKAELLHLNSTYLHTLPKYLNESTEKLFLNVSHSHFDLVRFNGDKKLRLMNRYPYQASSDFIYFVLLCCEELKINREETELVLMGNIDSESGIYDLCLRYFRHLSFIQKPEAVNFTKAFENFPKHHHFNLYNLNP